MTSASSSAARPVLIICMGVSGCGKTTVATHLAERHNLNYVEADDFHPEENRSRMASGLPLTDAMREPWITAMCEHLSNLRSQGKHCVMANSCLRRAHRQRFRELGFHTLFLFLHGSKDVIRQRMESRSDHFMPAQLLDSQFATLEFPGAEPDVTQIDIEQTRGIIAQQVDNCVKKLLQEG